MIVKRDYLSVLFLSIAVRIAVVAFVDGPGYLDAAYSYDIGREIAAGHGFLEPFVWHWLRPPAGVPQPAFDYWMPGESLLIAASTFLIGATFKAAQVPNLVFGAVLPVIAFWNAASIGLGRRGRWLAALLCLTTGPNLARWATTDPFVVFSVFGAASLRLAAGRGRLSAATSGVLAGLAQLTRSDGGLLLAPYVAGMRTAGGFQRFVVAAAASTAVGLPWLARNWATFGTAFPPAGFSAAFLQDYNDIFRPGGTTPAEFASSGLMAIAGRAATALGQNLLTLAGFEQFYLMPFLIIGWQARRNGAETTYFVALLVAMSLIFPLPGARGGFAHSLTALLPFLAACGADGVERAVGWLGAKRAWHVATARRNIGAIFVVGAAVASCGLAAQEIVAWKSWETELRAVGRSIEELGGGLPVLVDPPTYFAVTGQSAIVTPNLSVEKSVIFLRQYGARYLVVGPAHPSAWGPLYRNAAGPASLRQVGRVGLNALYQIDDQ